MAEDRQRADRTTEERTVRRRRDDTNLDASQRLKLAIPPKVQARLDAEGRTPRWVTKDSQRMYNLTKRDDYDRVEGVEPVTTRTLKGELIEQILLSKPTAFIEEDREKRETLRREQEQSMLRGTVTQGAPERMNDVYVAGGSEINNPRGRRSP